MKLRLEIVGMAAAAWVGVLPVQADVEPHAGMLRYPDVSESHIVFAYGNDLWVVSREGGVATPLASPPGAETFPRFSADGESIAFVGNYEGNRDIYVIPATGGIAERLTHHPSSENLCDWTPDGDLLYSSSGQSGLGRMPKLFTVSATGGLPATLPVPYGGVGAISPDGKWLAYTPHSRDSRTWKRYRGGMATDIWLFNLQTYESKQITDWDGTDTQPMWYGRKLYYLSDGGPAHRLNLWMFDPGTSERKQITRFEDYDVKWPSIGPGRSRGEIVFQNGAKLYLLDLGSLQSREVRVTIPGDRPNLRAQTIDASDFIQSADISSTGKRAVVAARGDIWTAPAEKGVPRNLTRTDGVAERDATWSPDGRWIAYFSDDSGDYELYITQSDGKGETRQLTTDGGPFKFSRAWSPDSKHILFCDKTGQMYLHTVESGETSEVDMDPRSRQPNVSWSHDSRWIAYDKSSEAIPTTAIWIYDVENGEARQVTSDMFGDGQPVFDRKGDYLYFASSRTFNPTYSDIDTTFVYRQSQNLLAVPLRADMDNPWAVKSDEETWEEDEEADEEEPEETDEADDGDDADEDEEEAAPVEDDGLSGTWNCEADTPDVGRLDFTLVITLNPDNTVTGSLNSMMGSSDVTGTYDPDTGELKLTAAMPNGPVIVFDLKVDGGTLSGTGNVEGTDMAITGSRAPAGSEDEDGDGEGDEAREEVTIDFDGFERRGMLLPVPGGQFGKLAVNNKNQLIYVRRGQGGAGIKLFDITDEKKEEKSVADGAASFEISGDGKKLLVVRGSKLSIQNASAGASGKNVVTDGMMARIDPREEWRQMFHDAWRIFRDYFYVENMHGVDWPAIRDQYAAMLDDCASRDDLNYVIGEMISELNVGHAYRGGGDLEDQPSMSVGMLGVDFELDNGAYRIARIHEGGPWDADARGPLSAPGVDVKEGDYLLAVNHLPLDTSQDPWVAFLGTANRATILTVSDSPEMDENAREVIIKPISSESGIRYRSWIEKNRRYVEEETDGQVGYIYVPNTGVQGQNELVRQFYGQIGKKALIIDERWNGGGQIPTRFIEMLNRPRTNYWAVRNGKDWAWPPDSHQGPKCMLINGLAGSGGDMFPWLFRQAGLGPLIGTRTWGGLVGISGNPGLIDGGFIAVPTFGFYEIDGTWGVEGHGTDPDIEVIDDPALMVDGGDPQLDMAIEVMLEAIAQQPYTPPARPSPPDRSGMGVLDTDK
ncbi:MAG: S41 family peptidase [Planctomycetota bacterium]|jgi:tricorn protease